MGLILLLSFDRVDEDGDGDLGTVIIDNDAGFLIFDAETGTIGRGAGGVSDDGTMMESCSSSSYFMMELFSFSMDSNSMGSIIFFLLGEGSSEIALKEPAIDFTRCLCWLFGFEDLTHIFKIPKIQKRLSHRVILSGLLRKDSQAVKASISSS